MFDFNHEQAELLNIAKAEGSVYLSFNSEHMSLVTNGFLKTKNRTCELGANYSLTNMGKLAVEGDENKIKLFCYIVKKSNEAMTASVELFDLKSSQIDNLAKRGDYCQVLKADIVCGCGIDEELSVKLLHKLIKENLINSHVEYETVSFWPKNFRLISRELSFFK